MAAVQSAKSKPRKAKAAAFVHASAFFIFVQPIDLDQRRRVSGVLRQSVTLND
jgi:hypothetical protein